MSTTFCVLIIDDAKPPHVQGQGIVKDIAALYGGSLELAKSELGGFAAQAGSAISLTTDLSGKSC